jgi:fructose-bisphosphate aldolase, class II
MPLVSGLEMLRPARQHKYAVGAFNCINLEYVRAVINVARELNSPIIVALTPGALKYSGWDALPAAVRAMAEASSIPVAMHLDHGTKIMEVEMAARAGFSSIMIDGAALPYDQNVEITKAAAEIAHAAGASLEGELGEIGGQEEHIVSEGVMTDPDAVAGFVDATHLDVLATSFGSVHQKATRDAVLDLERLEKIAAATSAPLVLHGGSGVPDDQLRAVIARGVAKVNVGTEMQRTFSRVLRETAIARPDEWDTRKLLGPATTALEAVIRARLEPLGSAGRG